MLNAYIIRYRYLKYLVEASIRIRESLLWMVFLVVILLISAEFVVEVFRKHLRTSIFFQSKNFLPVTHRISRNKGLRPQIRQYIFRCLIYV